jgi:hypothetical protein
MISTIHLSIGSAAMLAMGVKKYAGQLTAA